jgi:hypothetical protein
MRGSFGAGYKAELKRQTEGIPSHLLKLVMDLKRSGHRGDDLIPVAASFVLVLNT